MNNEKQPLPLSSIDATNRGMTGAAGPCFPPMPSPLDATNQGMTGAAGPCFPPTPSPLDATNRGMPKPSD